MQKKDVVIGAVYEIKVAGAMVAVRLDRVHAEGGWIGNRLDTQRELHIKNARQLRVHVPPPCEKKAGRRASLKGVRAKRGCLEAAVEVLAKTGEPLACKQIMDRILAQKL